MINTIWPAITTRTALKLFTGQTPSTFRRREISHRVVCGGELINGTAPILARGGDTGIPGQSVNVAVVIDFSKYMRNVIAVDPQRRLARVEPGCVLDTLRDAAEKHHLTFGPDPATHNRNTLRHGREQFVRNS